MKHALVAALSLALSITVAHAAEDPKEKAKAKEKAKQEEKAAREKKREAVNEVLKAKDKNDDGSLTLDEYLTGETDVEAATKNFEKFNKNKDRVLSKEEIAASLGM
jgi:uncharacterized protein YdeI (BOF family)